MKKFLLLTSVLMVSTALLGVESPTETVNGVITGDAGMTSTTSIKLIGQAINVVKLTSDTKNVDFGTVLVGRTSTATVNLKVQGEKGYTVALATDMSEGNITVSGLENVQLEEDANDQIVPMTLTYIPTAKETINKKLTITATYTDEALKTFKASGVTPTQA